MTRYDQLAHKGTGLAFIVGPCLWLLAALIKISGVALNPSGRESVLEGVLIGYAALLFIRIYLELARRLGQRSPIFGLVCACLGVAGMASAMSPAMMRILDYGLYLKGFTEPIWSITPPPHALPLAILPLFGPLTSILLGVGHLRARVIPTLWATLLIVAGVSFMLAQAANAALAITYPGATLAWLIALAPLGWGLLTRQETATSAVKVAPGRP